MESKKRLVSFYFILTSRNFLGEIRTVFHVFSCFWWFKSNDQRWCAL